MNFFTMSLYHFLIKRYSELKTCKRSCWNRPFESLWYVTFNCLEFWGGLNHLFRSLQPGGQRDIIREYHGPGSLRILFSLLEQNKNRSIPSHQCLSPVITVLPPALIITPLSFPSLRTQEPFPLHLLDPGLPWSYPPRPLFASGGED